MCGKNTTTNKWWNKQSTFKRRFLVSFELGMAFFKKEEGCRKNSAADSHRVAQR